MEIRYTKEIYPGGIKCTKLKWDESFEQPNYPNSKTYPSISISKNESGHFYYSNGFTNESALNMPNIYKINVVFISKSEYDKLRDEFIEYLKIDF